MSSLNSDFCVFFTKTDVNSANPVVRFIILSKTGKLSAAAGMLFRKFKLYNCPPLYTALKILSGFCSESFFVAGVSCGIGFSKLG